MSRLLLPRGIWLNWRATTGRVRLMQLGFDLSARFFSWVQLGCAGRSKPNCIRVAPSRVRANSASILGRTARMGWVNDGQLASELNTGLVQVGGGAFPIRSVSTAVIVLGFAERQEPLGTKIVERHRPTGPAGTLRWRACCSRSAHSPSRNWTRSSRWRPRSRNLCSCAQLDDLHNKMTGTVI